MNLTRKSLLTWHKAICPICGREYEHLAYKPKTCGKFDCIQQGWKMGIFDKDGNKMKPQIPEFLESSGDIYSNFDHTFDLSVVRRIQANPDFCASHPAWNFCGEVWHTNGIWVEDVYQYHRLVGVYQGKNLRELVELVNAEYGWE